MSDIFISYAREDQTRAILLADLLAQRGWTVWWDRNIPAGKSFDEVIESELDLAKCVIVLWSKVSVSSDWVKAEAAEGAGRGILIPVAGENVRLPLEFRRLQTIMVSNWQGTVPESELAAVFSAVDTTLGGTDTSGVTRTSQSQTTEAPPLPQALLSQSKEWRAELISKSRSDRSVKIYLSTDHHVIEAKFYMIRGVVVKLDGDPLPEIEGDFLRAIDVSFFIRDGAQQYPATITIYPLTILSKSLTLGIERVRLRVNGHTLYEEAGK
jgi:TIR domain